MKVASLKVQKKWIPKDFRIDEEFGCQTCAEQLEASNPNLTFQIGRTRIGKDKWGDHAWCTNPYGDIIDPYFQWRFPNECNRIEYVIDHTVFDGLYEMEGVFA